jgi:hypothetical protein
MFCYHANYPICRQALALWPEKAVSWRANARQFDLVIIERFALRRFRSFRQLRWGPRRPVIAAQDHRPI